MHGTSPFFVPKQADLDGDYKIFGASDMESEHGS